MTAKDHPHQDKNKIEVESEAPALQENGEAVSPLEEQILRLQAEKEELSQTMVRRQADFENYRKRIERERHEEHRRGVGRLVEELLPVLDALERALQIYADPQHADVRKGLQLIYRQLWDILARHGLERIDAAGKPFDPNFHQAIERVETSEQPEGTIVEVVQDGYLYHGRVLRPAAVRVSAQSDEPTSAVERRGA